MRPADRSVVIICRKMVPFRVLFRTAVLYLTIAAPIQSQTPEFEVASIKPSPPGARGATFYNPTRERFAITSVTAKALIAYAYDVRDFQVSGGPGWVTSDEFDIVAKPQGDFSGAAILAMAKALLADRFSLRLHSESKEMPVYALVVAKGGLRLTPSVGQGPEVRGGRGRLTARNVTMGMLAAQLSGRVLGRSVLDQTGVSGQFDINLEWTPDENPDGGPSIFAALQEQLGLRLETRRAPVDVLVIDHVEKPTAN